MESKDIKINISELAFIMSWSQPDASYFFKLTCQKLNIDYSNRMRLPAGTIEKAIGWPIIEKLDDIRENYLKRTESKALVLNDLKSINKGRFAGKLSTLKRLLPEDAINFIKDNWNTKSQLLQNQLTLEM